MNTSQPAAIATLMREHAEVKERFADLLASQGDARLDILDDIKSALALHNATEENVIYPAIHSFAQRPMHARTLYHEQDDAEIALWDLSTLDPGDPEFERKAAELRDALLAHVKREEESEFMHLCEELTPEDAARLDADFRQFRASIAASHTADR